MAPAARSTLRMVPVIFTGLRCSRAGFASAMKRRRGCRRSGASAARLCAIATPSGARGFLNRREKSSPFAFQWLTTSVRSSICIWPTISSKVRKPSARHHLAHFLGDEEEIVDDVLGLAGEALAQHRVLRGHAHRAGVQVALAHHDAAGGNQRRPSPCRTRRRRAARPRSRRARCGCRRPPARRCGRAAGCAPASGGSRRGRFPKGCRRASAR